MESQPKFIKEFSKEESQPERDQLALEIRQERAKNFEVIKEAENLSSKIEETSVSLPGKISDFFKFIKIRSRLMNNSVESVQTDALETNLPDSMKDAKLAIEDFYTKQKVKWENNPYSKEDIEKHFSPEHLASLSLDEYILLLKRFPSQMLTHVTRQGVRDHIGAVNHHAGVDQMSNGFKDIAKDGKLKSSFSIHVTENAKKEAIADFLNLENKTQEQAIQDIDYLAGEETQHHHGSFADRKSVHLATEEVADAHYGSETGNEIFFSYPSAMIASQYVFSGQLSKAEGGYHNNQWVFFNEDEGLDIDAGLVFIPKNVQVDKKTGSKYELNENLEPIENKDLYSQVDNLISNEDFKSFVQEYKEVLGGSRELVAKKKVEAAQILEEKFLITDKTIQEMVIDYSFLGGVPGSVQSDKEKKDFINGRMREVGCSFVLAKDTVPSEQYWNEYFNENKKPSKIVFYEESDPTLALKNWRLRNDLDKKDQRPDLGFGENQVNLSDAEDVKNKVPSIGRFKNLAESVVEDFYNKE